MKIESEIEAITFKRGNATLRALGIALDTIGIAEGEDFIISRPPTTLDSEARGADAASRPRESYEDEEESMNAANETPNDGPDVITVYPDKATPRPEWRWYREAPNGRKVADSGEGYTEKHDAIDAAKRESDGKCEIRVLDQAVED